MRQLILIILTLLCSTLIFAESDCLIEANDAFSEIHPKLDIIEVKDKGLIAPNSDMPYFQGDIWNDTASPLKIIEIEAFFMASFTYVVLVRPNSCKVENIIEVGFED